MNGLFSDIGACIYCGDKALPLSREHVLPRGLGGSMSPDGYSDALVLQNIEWGSGHANYLKI